MSVYTSLNPAQLAELLSPFPLGKIISHEGIADGIENTNYRIKTESGCYILTIFERHTVDEMPFFLQLMAHLQKQGLAVPAPISDSKQTVLTFWQAKPVAVFNQLPGQSLNRIQPHHCQQIGAALGHLHLAGQTFALSRKNDRDDHWIQNTGTLLLKNHKANQSLATPLLSIQDAELLNKELQFQLKHADQELPQGIIHADLFRDNVLFHHDRLSAILDFYTACRGPLLFDLAIAVNDWCINPEQTLDAQKTESLLRAYIEVRPLSNSEKHFWPIMLRKAALRFWLSRLLFQQSSRTAQLTQDKDPDVLKYCLINHRENRSPSLPWHNLSFS